MNISENTLYNVEQFDAGPDSDEVRGEDAHEDGGGSEAFYNRSVLNKVNILESTQNSCTFILSV